MKNIIIVSDTHGNKECLLQMKEVFANADFIFHLGDVVSDAIYLKNTYGDKVVFVHGNCDGMLGEDYKIVEIENVKILLTHGNYYGVKSSRIRLAEKCVELGINYCFYGHTHNYLTETLFKTTLINGGTLSKTAACKSYIYATVLGNKLLFKPVKI